MLICPFDELYIHCVIEFCSSSPLTIPKILFLLLLASVVIAIEAVVVVVVPVAVYFQRPYLGGSRTF